MMKIIFAVLSIVTGFAMFVPYTVNMWKGTAKPHLFSWTTWGILTGLGFILSITNGGGWGASFFALQSVSCFVVAVYALFKGEKNITKVDWWSFICALIVAVIYAYTRDVLLSVVLAATIDILGFIPTFRKSYDKPYAEPATAYFLSSLGFLFSLGALETYSFVTLFYPLALIVTQSALVTFLLVRRTTTPRGLST